MSHAHFWIPKFLVSISCLFKGGKEERRKWVTVDKEALLAFVYYDTTHTGYIEDKDLEDMFYTLGLQVSRAQVTVALCSLPPGRAECVVTLTLTYIKSERSDYCSLHRYLHGMKTLKALALCKNFYIGFLKNNRCENLCPYIKMLKISLQL